MATTKAWLCVVVIVLMSFGAAVARAGVETTGVVILHGKWGSPKRLVSKLAADLENEGFLVAAPEMPWSGERLYDKGVADAMAEIDTAVNKLRSKGATRIFLAGHSLGGAAALRYGSHAAIDGLIILAPGHFPEGKAFKSKLEPDIRRAREMVQTHKEDVFFSFTDPNSGNRKKDVTIAAKIFLDYFDSDGPMNSRSNASSLRSGVPVLWIVGTAEDEGIKRLGGLTREKLPHHPGSRFIEVDADHMGTPDHAVGPVINWIKGIN